VTDELKEARYQLALARQRYYAYHTKENYDKFQEAARRWRELGVDEAESISHRRLLALDLHRSKKPLLDILNSPHTTHLEQTNSNKILRDMNALIKELERDS
jgi:hypothetical protein